MIEADTPVAARTVLFRADGGHALGFGHIMRCLAIASCFDEFGWNTVFAVGSDEPTEALLKARGVKFESICFADAPATHAGQIQAAVTEYGADVIVVDLSHRYNSRDPQSFAEFFDQLKLSKRYLVLIDGAATECISELVSLPADLIVRPYVGDSVSISANVLFGTKYAIYRPEFRRGAKRLSPVSEAVTRILISMGGSDPYGLTAKALSALRLLDLQGVTVDVVVGPGISEHDLLNTREVSEKVNATVRVLHSPDNFAECLVESDLAIINDGLTKYETAVTGTPAIVLSHDKHQEVLSAEFNKIGCTVPVSPEVLSSMSELAATIDSVIKDVDLRKSMSQIGLQTFDTDGGLRIVQQIEKELNRCRASSR